MNGDDVSALAGLDKIRKEAESQKVLMTKTITSGSYKSPMRERMSLQNGTFYGATVVSVEGESFWQGAYLQRGAGFLGWWVSMEEVMEEWRIFFTTPNGMRFDSRGVPVKNQDFTLHPLCAEGTFIVPKNGGIVILDDGHLILLSKSGLFRGAGGWELAQEFQAKYRDIFGAYQMQGMRIDQLAKQLDTAQECFSEAEAQRDGVLAIVKDVQLKYGRVMTSYNRFQVEKDTLIAQLDAMHQVNQNIKLGLRSTCANLAKQVDDLLSFIETQHIEDSIRAHKSQHPKIMDEKKSMMKDQWGHEGVVKPTNVEKAVSAIGEAVQEMGEQVERLSGDVELMKQGQQEQAQQSQEDKPSDNIFRRGLRRMKEDEQPEPQQTEAKGEGESQETKESEE